MQDKQKNEGRGEAAERLDPVLSLKRFALVISGDEARASQLMAMLERQMDLPQSGDVAAGTLQFLQFRRLYEMWRGVERSKPETAGLFAPGNANEAIRKGLDPQIAAVLGSLPSQHRVLLLLVYGESYSYAATARLLGISIEQLMNALARARARFAETATQRDGLVGTRATTAKGKGVVDDAA